MNNPKYLKIINENENCDYRVFEMINKEFSREYRTLAFDLKNENSDNLIKNPYKTAIESINIKCMYSVLLINIPKREAYSFDKVFYNGEETEILIEDIGIERFSRKSQDFFDQKHVYIGFQTFALEDWDLIKISQMESIKEVLRYLKSIKYYKKPVKATDIEVTYSGEDCDLPF